MAGGWARDGAVNEQIEASIEDELLRMRTTGRPRGESSAALTPQGQRNCQPRVNRAAQR